MAVSGFQNVSRMMEMMSTYEFVKLQNEISPTDMAKTYLKEYEGKQYTLDDYRDVEAYDWQRAVSVPPGNRITESA